MRLYPQFLRRWFEDLLEPLVQRLVRSGAAPNRITTVGTLVLIGSGIAFGLARVKLGAFLLLLSGVFDMLDGRVARSSHRTTPFGAFYDSTLDRIGEAALFTGIAVFFMTGGIRAGWEVAGVVVTVLTMAAGLVVSYARARAEGLDLDCKVGVAQRAERILGLGVPTLFLGAGPEGMLLFGIVAVLGVLAAVTVAQRIVHVYRLTRDTGSGSEPATREVSESGPESHMVSVLVDSAKGTDK